MSKVVNSNDFSTKLSDEQFLRFADNSTMGIAIIQRGYLMYSNQKFSEIFGYSKDDILKWRKREFYKIVHPEDLPHLIERFQVGEDKKTVTVRFRGITKNNKMINIENYICYIKYNDKTAYLSSYALLEKPNKIKPYASQTILIKSRKLIVLEYNPEVVKFLNERKVKFDIIKNYSYRELD